MDGNAGYVYRVKAGVSRYTKPFVPTRISNAALAVIRETKRESAHRTASAIAIGQVDTRTPEPADVRSERARLVRSGPGRAVSRFGPFRSLSSLIAVHDGYLYMSNALVWHNTRHNSAHGRFWGVGYLIIAKLTYKTCTCIQPASRCCNFVGSLTRSPNSHP